MVYESGPQRWSGRQLESRIGCAQGHYQVTRPTELSRNISNISSNTVETLPGTLHSTGILALPFFLLHLIVYSSARHEPELDGSMYVDAIIWTGLHCETWPEVVFVLEPAYHTHDAHDHTHASILAGFCLSISLLILQSALLHLSGKFLITREKVFRYRLLQFFIGHREIRKVTLCEMNISVHFA